MTKLKGNDWDKLSLEDIKDRDTYIGMFFKYIESYIKHNIHSGSLLEDPYDPKK